MSTDTPAQWRMVPVEPTDEMLDAAASASMQHLLDCIKDPKLAKEIGSEVMVRKTHASRYRSMLAASPQPTAAQPRTRAATDVLAESKRQIEKEGPAVRAAFEAWAAQRWGREAFRHTSATCAEWDAWQAATLHERIDELVAQHSPAHQARGCLTQSEAGTKGVPMCDYRRPGRPWCSACTTC